MDDVGVDEEVGEGLDFAAQIFVVEERLGAAAANGPVAVGLDDGGQLGEVEPVRRGPGVVRVDFVDAGEVGQGVGRAFRVDAGAVVDVAVGHAPHIAAVGQGRSGVGGFKRHGEIDVEPAADFRAVAVEVGAEAGPGFVGGPDVHGHAVGWFAIEDGPPAFAWRHGFVRHAASPPFSDGKPYAMASDGARGASDYEYDYEYEHEREGGSVWRWELLSFFLYPLCMETLPFEFAMEKYPLAPLTLYQVGGPARVALLPRTLDEASEAYRWMAQQPDRHIVLGGGSNVLIDDKGFDGIVYVTTKLDGIEALGDDRYHVLAGVVLDRMVREVMLANNYDLVGGLTGIPGTVGGAIYMNAGTNKGSTCMLMESVDVATPEGLRCIPMDESLYSYRGQTFCPRGSLILGGTFRFSRAAEDQQAIYDRYIQRRKEKQPQGKCCGSVFKNPEGDHSGRSDRVLRSEGDPPGWGDHQSAAREFHHE